MPEEEGVEDQAVQCFYHAIVTDIDRTAGACNGAGNGRRRLTPTGKCGTGLSEHGETAGPWQIAPKGNQVAMVSLAPMESKSTPSLTSRPGGRRMRHGGWMLDLSQYVHAEAYEARQAVS